MFENRYDMAYKLLIAAFILLALYSMMHTGAAIDMDDNITDLCS